MILVIQASLHIKAQGVKTLYFGWLIDGVDGIIEAFMFPDLFHTIVPQIDTHYVWHVSLI